MGRFPRLHSPDNMWPKGHSIAKNHHSATRHWSNAEESIQSEWNAHAWAISCLTCTDLQRSSRPSAPSAPDDPPLYDDNLLRTPPREHIRSSSHICSHCVYVVHGLSRTAEEMGCTTIMDGTEVDRECMDEELDSCNSCEEAPRKNGVVGSRAARGMLEHGEEVPSSMIVVARQMSTPISWFDGSEMRQHTSTSNVSNGIIRQD